MLQPHLTFIFLANPTRFCITCSIFIKTNSLPSPNSHALAKLLEAFFSQKALEAFSSQVRRMGGSNEAPNVLAYARCQRLISCKKRLKQVRGNDALT